MTDLIQGILYDTDEDTKMATYRNEVEEKDKVSLYKTENNRYYKYIPEMKLIIPVFKEQASAWLKDKGFIKELVTYFPELVQKGDSSDSIPSVSGINVTKIFINEKNGPNNHSGRDIIFIYTNLPCLDLAGNATTLMLQIAPDIKASDYVKKHFPLVKDVQFMMHGKDNE